MSDECFSRQASKAQLLDRLRGMNFRESLFPQEDDQLTDLVIQLEQVNPTPYPLQSECLPALIGDWQLIFASRGTVVTRSLDPFSGMLAGITIERIWQRLRPRSDRTLYVENGSEMQLPWFGTWQLRAEGVWQWDVAEQTAKVSFNAFSVQAANFLEQSNWRLPVLSIPVLETLRREALWITSYLDEDLRIGRGATGKRFVFQRQGQVAGDGLQ